MARRKRQLLDDSGSGSSGESLDGNDDFELDGDPDLRAEQELFKDPYGRKRRRKMNDDETYGIFGEDGEEEGFKSRNERSGKRSDWTKAPSFISGEKKVDIAESLKTNEREHSSGDSKDDVDKIGNIEDGDEESAEDSSDNDSDAISEESVEPKTFSPRIREDEDEVQVGGLGSVSRKSGNSPAPTSSSFQQSFHKGGIGSSRGGIGSSHAASSSSREQSDLPSSFSTSLPQRSFIRNESSGPTGTSATPLSHTERLHFHKLQGSFGARMLSKMGWQSGSGLGVEGTGIVTPVESKLRPKGMGIAFKGFKEKTEQSKAEARRRGEVVSEDDEKPRRTKKQEKRETSREDMWKKSKKSKIRVEHKTYEEIIAEAGGDVPTAGVGKIIDATGATLREVSSLADISQSSWTPSTDTMRLPEVRHNLRLITESCKVDLDGLAREAKALVNRGNWIQNEDPKLRRKIESEADLIRRLQAIHLIVDDINTKAKEVSTSDYESTLDTFSPLVEKLLAEYPKEYDRYRLDEVIVAAITPMFRGLMTSWKPLENPTAYTSILRQWRNALKMAVSVEPQTQVDVFGVPSTPAKLNRTDVPMTPYESLLWNVWVPKIRSSINNDWSATDPTSMVKLLEAWSDLLPIFILDNILDQLILPKVSSAIANWIPKKGGVSLQSIVFPWLPHVGLRMEQFIDEARRKVKNMLRSWKTSDGVPKDLLPWKEVFNAAEWEAMLLKYIVPKLGATLHDDFRVNPRNQNMEPLQCVLQWCDIIRESIFGQLLEVEFFPKWLDVLHIWLIQPNVNYEEVAQWYEKVWKATFPQKVLAIPAVAQGFTKGLELIQKALDLGADAPKKLPKPDHSRHSSIEADAVKQKERQRTRPSRTQEITFRSIVEDYVAAHNLLFMPAGKVHNASRMPLFRVSRTVDGKGGLLVYLLDDAVWATDGDDYRAITLEDMVLKANKGSQYVHCSTNHWRDLPDLPQSTSYALVIARLLPRSKREIDVPESVIAQSAPTSVSLTGPLACCSLHCSSRNAKMSFSDVGSTMSSRPDRPLVVKATFDRSSKLIRFSSARNCSYELLKTRVEQSFSLSSFSFSIAYKDDDGEVTDIVTESDLTEAIQYFQAGVDDLPVSSAQSILSGRGFGTRKITLRVTITVDYDGPSLSDTSSLASIEDYRNRNNSGSSLSLGSILKGEQDDDEVTVSSRDTGMLVGRTVMNASALHSRRHIPSAIQDTLSYSGIETNYTNLMDEHRAAYRYPEDPSAVFERLKLNEASSSGNTETNERSVQWLRDQKSRTFIGITGRAADSETSESISDATSFSFGQELEEQSPFDGDLALQQDNSGKYYYTYTSGSSSSASQAHGFADDEYSFEEHDNHGLADCNSTKLHWIASQQTLRVSKNANGSSSSSRPAYHTANSDPLPRDSMALLDLDIPPEVLQFVDQNPQPPAVCTTCSECGIDLDAFRYVCSTCGEKEPRPRIEAAMPNGKGKEKDISIFDPLAYPPPSHRTPIASATSSLWPLLNEIESKPLPSRPLPALPAGRSPPSTINGSPSSTRSASSATLTNGINHSSSKSERGYELCVSCIESAGVMHALETSMAPDTNAEPSSPEEAQRSLSQWRRSAPKQKGHFRHAYLEKVWNATGWKDVEQDDMGECTICNTSLTSQRYKCASCKKFILCRACYSQVHEIHPSHAFLVVPEHPLRVRSEPDLIDLANTLGDDGLGEQSLTHPGVKCTHCLMDIVGARFHCAICESVDICSNCEAAGLPGNLDAPDGGHNSSHIMIKIPIPLNSTKVQTASRRALQLWTGRDAPNVQRPVNGRARANSSLSVDAVTVLGSGTNHSQRTLSTSEQDSRDHHVFCKGCNQNIVGVRYQCAMCPSMPAHEYSLCTNCEARSYILHDPNHIFFKLPRPVDRPIESQYAILPILYKQPVGPINGLSNSSDPKAYLQSLYHAAALCDRCMERIRGEWFRCVYCAKDLCDVCEGLDAHDSTHFFYIFKATVDMQIFRHVAELDNPRGSPPVLKYPVYYS